MIANTIPTAIPVAIYARVSTDRQEVIQLNTKFLFLESM